MSQEYADAMGRLNKDAQRKVVRPANERLNDLQTVVLQLANNTHVHLEEEPK